MITKSVPRLPGQLELYRFKKCRSQRHVIARALQLQHHKRQLPLHDYRLCMGSVNIQGGELCNYAHPDMPPGDCCDHQRLTSFTWPANLSAVKESLLFRISALHSCTSRHTTSTLHAPHRVSRVVASQRRVYASMAGSDDPPESIPDVASARCIVVMGVCGCGKR